MEWVRVRAAVGAFEYLPLGSPSADARVPNLRNTPRDAGMRVITPDKRCLVGADAVLEVLARLPRWRALAAVLRLPGVRAVFGCVYRLIAKHRDRLQ